MKKRNVILFVILLIIQIVVQIVCGCFKQYYHMDEAYSLGLSNYDKVEIQDNSDFYDTWHNGAYYEDYLAVQDKDKGNYTPVYENQKNDVHPPFYYLLLRFFMGFSINHFSKWPGIILNIIIYTFISFFMFLILKRLFKNETIAIIIAVLSSITMASLTSAIYIRMYALSTLNVLITLYLHFKLYEEINKNHILLPLIGISAFIGSLTHYYYLFFLFVLYIMFMIKFIREKNYKLCMFYTLTMCTSAGLSLLVFPYSINHLFFGYRGQGALSNLSNVSIFFSHIWDYVKKINIFAFNDMFYVILGIIALLFIIKCIKLKKLDFNASNWNKYIKFVIIPTLVYFVIVAVASPWIELRYIMPICSLVFSIVIFYLYSILNSIFTEKVNNICLIILFIIILIMPIPFDIEAEVEYSDKKEIVQFVKSHSNLPTVYLFNTENNRFLDDIYLFSLLDNSYVARNFDCTQTNIFDLLDDKNISNGVIIFINEGYDNDEQLQAICNSLDLSNFTHLKRLNACDVYLVN